MDVREIGWFDMGWAAVAQNRNQWKALVNAVMNFQFPQNVVKFLNGCATVGLSSSAQSNSVTFTKIMRRCLVFPQAPYH
jgi:hypothetical protein